MFGVDCCWRERRRTVPFLSEQIAGVIMFVFTQNFTYILPRILLKFLTLTRIFSLKYGNWASNDAFIFIVQASS